jgi:hypothetical protein
VLHEDPPCATRSRQFDPGELKTKLDAEERLFARKSNLVFAILMLAVLMIFVYVIAHPDLNQPIRSSTPRSVEGGDALRAR